MSPARKKSSAAGELKCQALLDRATWGPLPAVVLLTGDAPFFKEQVIQRFSRELFGSASPEVRRFQGPGSDQMLADLPLSTVLDDLRTPSFFSSRRLVVVEDGDAFLSAHRDAIEPFAEKGFSSGHLIVTLRGKLDGRTRFAKAVARSGWIVRCPQPYDRPPPWDFRTPIWDSELSHWLTRRARDKDLVLDPRVAFLLHERAGTDLAVLDEEIEKIATYLAAKGSHTVDAETVSAVCGDLKEDSIFVVVDALLEGRKPEAARGVERLFQHGYHAENRTLVLEPTSIALPFIGAMLSRLRSLRRAHAMAAEGATSDDWIQQGLVQRPFIARFQRQLRANSPARIRSLVDRLYRTDCAIKRGGDARRLIFLLAAE
jgi:DNA polymerase III delta subunit